MGVLGSNLLLSRPAAAAGPSGLYVARRSGAEIFLPSTNPPVTVTSAAAIFTFGPWVAVGTNANPLYLSAFSAVTNALVNMETGVVELAYGDAKTPIDVTRMHSLLFNPGATTVFYTTFPIWCRPVEVPAGETIYARAATNTAIAKDFLVWVTGWDGQVPTWQELARNYVTGPGRYYPANTGAAGVTVTSGASWAYGASAQVVASAPNDLLVTQLVCIEAVSHLVDPSVAVQVGYGPNGSETWCATIPWANADSPHNIHPPVLVQSGERLALRSADATVVGRGFFVKVYDC